MLPNRPMEFLRGKYAGPGAQEWVLGLMTTALLSGNLQARFNTEGLQNANRYYFRGVGIGLLQNLGVIVDLLVIFAIVGWLVWPSRRVWFEATIMSATVLGPPVVWAELILALSTQPNRVFVLESLPFRPVNNIGLLGSSVFLLYLLSKQRFTKKLWADLLIKVISASVVVAGQMFAYQSVVARHSR